MVKLIQLNRHLILILNIYVWLKIKRYKATEKLGWYIIGFFSEKRFKMLKKGNLDSFKLYYEPLSGDSCFNHNIRHTNRQRF